METDNALFPYPKELLFIIRIFESFFEKSSENFMHCTYSLAFLFSKEKSFIQCERLKIICLVHFPMANIRPMEIFANKMMHNKLLMK